MQLSEQEKRILLQIARESIKQIFESSPPSIVDYQSHPILKENNGVFVTLNLDGNLRGCIGYLVSPMPLFETVSAAAVQSAFKDPRFFPLDESELNKIDIEISILSHPVEIKSYDEIKLGDHGLLLDYNGYKSVLLPQVAVHYNYTIEQFLSALFEKAGLDPLTWRKKFVPLKIFTATVFSEQEVVNNNEQK